MRVESSVYEGLSRVKGCVNAYCVAVTQASVHQSTLCPLSLERWARAFPSTDRDLSPRESDSLLLSGHSSSLYPPFVSFTMSVFGFLCLRGSGFLS